MLLVASLKLTALIWNFSYLSFCKFCILVPLFGKKLITITDVLITVSSIICNAYSTFGWGSGIPIILTEIPDHIIRDYIKRLTL